MRLATIYSQSEEEELKNVVERAGLQKERFWISGSDLGHEGRFSWFSTGDPLEYKNYKVAQPDNFKGLEHCLDFNFTYGWNDAVCSTKLYFICERVFFT